ncbi:hypothetical protein ABZ801_30565 [Actinomadura sp. NPDC047616]|uniref:hypothetical protein n=1 Tax=Actinomadura sp. NPDC047616 TaxID=3155914 RepID=UPI0033E3DBAC
MSAPDLVALAAAVRALLDVPSAAPGAWPERCELIANRAAQLRGVLASLAEMAEEDDVDPREVALHARAAVRAIAQTADDLPVTYPTATAPRLPRCLRCDGTGADDGETCPSCHGDGYYQPPWDWTPPNRKEGGQ